MQTWDIGADMENDVNIKIYKSTDFGNRATYIYFSDTVVPGYCFDINTKLESTDFFFFIFLKHVSDVQGYT